MSYDIMWKSVQYIWNEFCNGQIFQHIHPLCSSCPKDGEKYVESCHLWYVQTLNMTGICTVFLEQQNTCATKK